MDFSESTKIVYNRIQKLEPENVSKIIGYLLLQDHGEREMIRLAFSPDNLICSLINKAKTELGLSTPSPTVSIPISEIDLQFTPYSPSSSHLITPNSYWDSVSEDYHLLNQIQLLSLEDQLESVNSINGLDFSSNNNNYFYPEPALGVRTSRRSPSLLDSPFKACHYFSKGFCRHGNNCRYFHGHPMPENFSQIFGPLSNNSNELIITNDHQDHGVISPVSLDKLEVEIIEILKSRRGVPVSIASLPLIYFEKYGKTLQADGYLTESQRHGKAGYNLTKLLARLQNNIRLIDRPHGQHSIILAEDILKYLEYSGERFEPSGIVAGSQQIYLTFPAMSAFTEQDVSNYFNQFGPVQDVRIPCQQKRMFGFVTFVFAETVKEILAKGNPHFVCGARVLVKPYREKSRVFERKCGGAENSQLPLYFNQHFMDGDSDLHSMPRVCDNPRFMRKRFIEENEQACQLDQNHLQFAMKNWSSHPYFGYSMEEFKHPEGRVEQAEFPSAERFNYLLDVLNNGSTSSEDQQHSRT